MYNVKGGKGMKCERCGNEEVRQIGHLLAKAYGAGATQQLLFKGLKGTIVAGVCDTDASRLRRIGWKQISE